MMFAHTMIEIVANGGGLDIGLQKNPVFANTMLEIARAAAASGKKPTIIFP